MERGCGTCVNFGNDPADLEASFPGLTSLSSAHISARADDGVCALHRRYLSASAFCGDYQQILKKQPVTARR
jgi:hypothetical protein